MDWIVSLPDRLDAFLAAEGRMLSRVKAQKAIEDGLVRVNDLKVKKPAMRLQEGDKVSLSENTQQATSNEQILPDNLHLSVLYEDAACWVINKPAGIAVHPGAGMAPGEKTLLHGVAHLYAEKGLPFSSESVLVHRLDKETTGCILVAKTPAAHLFLQEQFESRTVKKTYLALVAGIPEHSEATIDAPIGRSTSNRTKMAVERAGATRAAQTSYRVVASAKSASLLECDLHTGRTHQVRVHLSSIGHPVLGDPSYTNSLSERLKDDLEIQNLCLYAWKLEFESPGDQKRHGVEAEIPSAMKKVLADIGI